MSAASTAEPAFVAKTKTGRITDFVDSRVGGSGILREFGRKVFPDHWSFMFGEVALYSFVILLLSGTFLTFFFDPSMAETHYDGSYVPLKGVEMSVAYSSSLNISFDVRGGLFMRQVHHWAALLFVASVAVHMLRVFFTGAFRRPREMNWVVGCVLLILAMAAGFTGYSLPDDLLPGNGHYQPPVHAAHPAGTGPDPADDRGPPVHGGGAQAHAVPGSGTQRQQ